MPLHEDLVNRVAIHASTIVQAQDITNATNRDEYASATTVALWQAVNTAKELLAHECDKPIYAIASRCIAEAEGQAIYTTTEMAAANSDISATYLVSAGYRDNAPDLPVKYHGGRG